MSHRATAASSIGWRLSTKPGTGRLDARRADDARRVLRACVRYRLPDDSETEDFPAHQSDFHHCRPVFEVQAGWDAAIDDELPDAALAYVRFVEEALDVPVTLVGTGADREQVLAPG